MKTWTFEAQINDAGSGGAYVYLPYDVQAEFGARSRVPIKVKFDGVEYTGTLMKYGAPQHMLPILKAIRKQIGKQPGDCVRVELREDAAERTLAIPADFSALLKKEDLLAGFERLSLTHRKEYIRWVTEAKREDTRQRRLEKAVSMLRDGVKTPG